MKLKLFTRSEAQIQTIIVFPVFVCFLISSFFTMWKSNIFYPRMFLQKVLTDTDESEPVDASSIRYIESRSLIFPKCPKLPHCSKLAAENIWLHI
jgi:hypothetical protein